MLHNQHVDAYSRLVNLGVLHHLIMSIVFTLNSSFIPTVWTPSDSIFTLSHKQS